MLTADRREWDRRESCIRSADSQVIARGASVTIAPDVEQGLAILRGVRRDRAGVGFGGQRRPDGATTDDDGCARSQGSARVRGAAHSRRALLLRQTLGPVAAGASLSREQFECAWSSLASELSPNVMTASGAGSELRRCSDPSSPRGAPSPTCTTEWHQTETFNVTSNASESNWQREVACEAARPRTARFHRGQCCPRRAL